MISFIVLVTGHTVVYDRQPNNCIVVIRLTAIFLTANLSQKGDIMKKCYFGVFTQGKCLFTIGAPIECSDAQATLIVLLLKQANKILEPGQYFAYDYLRSR